MRPEERAVCVCFDGSRVLLMRRLKGGRRYTVLPGGGIEAGETPAQAAVRELAEETGLVGTVTGDIATVDHDDRRAHYLLLTALPGEPTLGGPEALAESEDNKYRPGWVPMAELADEPLVPEEAREIVLQAFARMRVA
ncbi:NUDIX domain-containing protein [Microbacterium sp. EST19A]|uniref:NUDIX domain-containing protein n=1 Tax=Microbacterium sp. EST19A TaxID=2862681 RepID=UPI001CBA9486|nr:NUDIX domain-containing protein [Microbacterium sp. EST19A]